MPIMTAHNEYARRSPDERFFSVSDMLAAAAEDKRLSVDRPIKLRDCRTVAEDDGIKFASPAGKLATFTHYAFGQLAGMVGAPANYLRSLSPDLGARALNEGIAKLPADHSAQILLRAANGRPEPLIRAVNGKVYSRLHDADWIAPLSDTLAPAGYRLPMAWDGKPAGAYRGDRDSFLILVNGGSIVEDPSLTMSDDPNGGAMYRGIMVRNSEVGYAARVIEQVLFRAICGNLMLWGAVIQSSSRLRHVGAPDKLLRETVREIGKIAHEWSNRPASADEAIIRRMIAARICEKHEDVVAELRAMGADKDTADKVVAAIATDESQLDPRSFWAVANGITRASQAEQFRDGRFELDMLAARVMARAQRVAA